MGALEEEVIALAYAAASLALIAILAEAWMQLRFLLSRNAKTRRIRSQLKDAEFKRYAECLTATNMIVKGQGGTIGYSLRPNADTVYDYPPIGPSHAVHINNIGIRHATDIDMSSYSRNSVLLLGDSVCFGAGLDFKDTIGARLDAALKSSRPDWDVFNFAVGGYSILDCIGNYRHKEAWRLNPRLVIYFHTVKSLFDYPRTNDPLTGFHIQKWRPSFLLHKCLVAASGGKENYLLGRLSAFAEDCEKAGAKFIFCSLPAYTMGRIYPSGSETPKYPEAIEFEKAFAARHPDRYLNARPHFDTSDPGRLFRRGANGASSDFEVHFSSEGIELLKDLIVSEIFNKPGTP